MINRVQNKTFCLHNVCTFNIYINKHMRVYIQEKYVLYIKYIYILVLSND